MKQKNVSWMNSVREISRPGDVMVDFCACACSTARAYKFFHPQEMIAGCGVDSEVVIVAERDLLIAFTSQC